MNIENLNELKKRMLFYVKHGLINTQVYNSAIARYVDADEDKVQEENDNYASQLIKQCRKHKLSINNLSQTEKNFLIYWLITSFTAKRSTSSIGRFFMKRSYSKARLADRVKPYRKNGYQFVDYNGETIEFLLLSKTLKTFRTEIAKRLETFDRVGYCHFDSIKICESILNEDANLVTGNICFVKKGDKMSHSWVEYKSPRTGKLMVIDFTMNVVMERDVYYKLQEVEVISVVPREKIIDAIENHKIFEKGYPLSGINEKILLFFFDDLIELSNKMMAEKQGAQMGE